MRGEMVSSVEREEADQQQRVEEAAALFVGSLNSLRRHPSDQMASAARESLLDLRPHVEAALQTLETIEGRRDLTDRERDLKHAFKMLLDAGRLPG
jgi:hypothetical protein